jgi:RNA polymerase sigma factor (sigma-70 family)
VSADGAEGWQYTLGEARKLLAVDSKRAEKFYEKVFLAYYGRVVAVLFRLVGDRNRAEDLANDVLWRAYRRHPGFVENGNLGGWLYRTAANLGIEELRAAARRQRYEHAAAEIIHNRGETGTPLDGLLQQETRARVRSILVSLKRWQARILILRQSGLSYGELADALGMKKSSVGTMLARAEAEFQKRYLRLHRSEE